MLMLVYLFSLLLCFNPVIVFFSKFSFPPRFIARLFWGQGSMVMYPKCLINLDLNLKGKSCRRQPETPLKKRESPASNDACNSDLCKGEAAPKRSY